jgi:hypothetical protein
MDIEIHFLGVARQASSGTRGTPASRLLGSVVRPLPRVAGAEAFHVCPRYMHSMAGAQNSEDVRDTTYARASRRCVMGLYAMSAIWGAVQIAFPESGVLYLVSALLFASLASGWASFDAKMRGIKIIPVLRMLYFFLWPIGAVVYLLFRSGLRGLLTAVVHGIGLITTLAVASYATLYGLHFAGMLDARYYQ